MKKTLEKHRENIFIYSFLGVLCSIPLNFAYSSIATIVFITLNLLSARKLKFFPLQGVYALLILIGIFAIISLAWTSYPSLSIVKLTQLFPLIAVPWVANNAVTIDKNKFYKIWFLFAIFLAFLFLIFLSLAIGRYINGANGSEFFYHALVAPLKLNAIYVSYLVSTCMLILLNHIRSGVSIILLLILSIFLLMLSSKMVISITFIGFAILWIKKFSISKKWIVLSAVILFSIVIIFPVFNRITNELQADYKEVLLKEQFGPIYDWKGGTIRVLMMRVSGEILQAEKAWVQGVGVGASQPYIRQNLKQKELYYTFYEYNFHNQFVQILVELGILGFILYIILFIRMYKDFNSSQLFMILITFMLFWGFSEAYLWRQRGLLSFLFIIISMYQTKWNSKSIDHVK